MSKFIEWLKSLFKKPETHAPAQVATPPSPPPPAPAQPAPAPSPVPYQLAPSTQAYYDPNRVVTHGDTTERDRYNTDLYPPGGDGRKFKPGRTEFTLHDVKEGQRLDFAIVCNGTVVWTLMFGKDIINGGNVSIDTPRVVAPVSGDYKLVISDAPVEGELNVFRN